MIRLNLTQFGGGRSGGGGGGGGTGNGYGGSKKTTKKELPAEIEERITDSNGNVREIANGFKYTIYRGKDVFYENVSPKDVRDYLEGTTLDVRTGLFVSDSGRTSYSVKISKRPSKSASKKPPQEKKKRQRKRKSSKRKAVKRNENRTD